MPESLSAAKRIDKGLILKALGEEQHENIKDLSWLQKDHRAM
jgi:hypothetical protein